MTDDRRMTTDRFYGGVSNRLENLQAMLEYVRDSSPTRSQLNSWVISNTRAGSEDAVSHHLTFLESIGLIKLPETNCELGKFGKQWLEDQSSVTLYNALSSGVKGFDTILQALHDGPMTDEEIMDLLVSEFDEAEMTKPGPAIRHREWLQVLGFVERENRINRLTENGRDLAETRNGESVTEPTPQSTELSLKEFYSEKEIEEIFKIELGNRISIINSRNDSQGKRFIILLITKNDEYTNTVTENRFEYFGQGKSKDKTEFPPGDSELIEAYNQAVPIYLFYAWSKAEDENWMYRGLVDIVSYKIQTKREKEIPVFTFEHQELFGEAEDTDKARPEQIQSDISGTSSSSQKEPTQGQVNSEPTSEKGDSQKKQTETPSVDELRERAEESAVEEVPEDYSTTTTQKPQYNRSPEVKRYVKARADGICEGCGDAAPFTSKTGEPYLHAHHIHELSDGGSDTPDTVVALCPNCHYRVHHGEDGDEYNQKLFEIVQEKENKNA